LKKLTNQFYLHQKIHHRHLLVDSSLFQGWIPERRDALVAEFAEAGQTDLDAIEETIRWDRIERFFVTDDEAV
jgi:hypothetical protein